MAAAVTMKRPAPDGDGPCSSGSGNKRRRLQFGEGSYGVVFKARQRDSGDMVAVKWIRNADGGEPADLRAVVREAGCMAACRGHPSVVEIRDVVVDEDNGDLFLVMEFVGPSLRRSLSRSFSEAETRRIVYQLLLGLQRILAAGMIHRDIKPENVLVGSGGALKICDFGMATASRPLYREEGVGSLWYTSPEQLLGSRFYGPAVDVWAVGCMMVELLTGRALFRHVKFEDDMMREVFNLRHEIETKGLQAFRGLLELSQAAGEVLLGLLHFDEDERLTAADALRHRWFVRGEDADSSAAAERESPSAS